MNFLRQAGARSGLYFLYICAQIFVLASLLLTITGIAVHLVLMTLTIGFYFATALKDVLIKLFSLEFILEQFNLIMKMRTLVSLKLKYRNKYQQKKDGKAKNILMEAKIVTIIVRNQKEICKITKKISTQLQNKISEETRKSLQF